MAKAKAKATPIPESWEKGKLDKKLDKLHGAKEGSAKDNAMDRAALAQKAKGLSDVQILAKAKAKLGVAKATPNKLMAQARGKGKA